MLSRDEPQEHHIKTAAFFLRDWEYLSGGRTMERMLAELLAKQERKLVERFDDALRGIESTLPRELMIMHDLDGNYAVAKRED